MLNEKIKRKKIKRKKKLNVKTLFFVEYKQHQEFCELKK